MVLKPPLSKPIAVLSIAGSDSGGGAGIQADLRTYAAHGLLGCTAITAITAQNTVGVRRWSAVDADLVREQITAVMEDLPVRAAKVGMVGSAEVVGAIADAWAELDEAPPLVLDTPLISSSGEPLLDDRALGAMTRLLLPLATVITPNWSEAAALLGVDTLDNATDAMAALAALAGGRSAVVLTGGHRAHGNQALDLVRLGDGRHLTLESPWVETSCTHGTGCTFSAAIAAALALGSPPEAAIQSAKHFLSRALLSATPMGEGHGPVDHLWALGSALVDPHD
jgi:hydroxymethylpyrimidine/phosphomethylpyrimidine kinase